MQICRSRQAVRDCVGDWRAAGDRVVLVATMGALHEGHMQLVAHGRDWLAAHGGGRVIASIFVNPAQFDRQADLALYPRDEDADIAMLRAQGCDAVFLPEVGDIYRPGAQTVVEVTGLSRILMGRLRPGHFRGVTTIVTKLFNIVDPDAATFGEKDYQQLTIVRQMVADLDMSVQIIAVPTVREPDGLAMSSRNRRLSPQDRAAAPILSQALDLGQRLVAQGARPDTIRRRIRTLLRDQPRARIRSVDIRDAADLSRITRIDRPVVILLSVLFSDVLLIDQRVAHP